jgi:5-formyltetrahydrofolate cyclo-ligase
MTKEEIRKHYLTLRLSLPDSELKKLSQNICDIFFESIDFSGIQTIHIFLPIKSKKEPDTWLIIEKLRKEHPLIHISVPKMNDEIKLINYYFESNDQLKENKWGVPEPQFGKITPVDKIDLAIVPMIAADQNGHRVGYGKGYYDRFLKEYRTDCKKVGLSMFEPVERISNIGSFDIKLDLIITPSRAVQLN